MNFNINEKTHPSVPRVFNPSMAIIICTLYNCVRME